MTPPPAATATGTRLRPGPAVRIPRRVSGARRVPMPRLAPRPAARAGGRALAGLLARAHLLLRGRAVIVVLAAMLLGLVFLQVSLLRLNTAISANVERAQRLERDNAAEKALISRLDAGERIQDVAVRLGMVMPAAGAVCYLDARRRGTCVGGDPAAAADPADTGAALAASDPAAATGADPAAAQTTGGTGATTDEPAAAVPDQAAPAGEPPPDAVPAPEAPEVAAAGGVDGGTLAEAG